MKNLALCCIVSLATLTTACQREPASGTANPPAEPTAQAVTATSPAPVPVAAPAPYPQATLALIEDYAAQAQTLSAQLTPGVDIAAATQAAESLLSIAAQIVPAFVERHPHCREYLAAAMQVRSGWRQMDAATLERDFHKDGALPEVEGDAKTCYHMKDLVVHPATALVLLTQSAPDVASAQKEINEVIAHAHVVKRM